MRDNLKSWVTASPVKADTGIRLSKAQTSSKQTLIERLKIPKTDRQECLLWVMESPKLTKLI